MAVVNRNRGWQKRTAVGNKVVDFNVRPAKSYNKYKCINGGFICAKCT
jgi:hypothetical protein